MEFSVVEADYDQIRDQDRIDHCLQELGERLARLAAPTDAADVEQELARARAELVRLGGLLAAAPGPAGRTGTTHEATAHEAAMDGVPQEAAVHEATAGLGPGSPGTAGAADPSVRADQVLLTAEREAAEIRARARADLAAAREEARQVRDRVYAEAVEARREFEAALHARRLRAERADEILRTIPCASMSRPGNEAERSEPVGASSTMDHRH
ncbi:hypothetical protein [Plantactinospora sonchi]|uniref:ATPase n=1 Tax=Plantactinospora sonchi TaxID=1544735 RepID=A0ABU7RTH7_9ACTN